MDVIKYRRYVISGAKYCCIKYIHLATDEVIKGWSREMVRTGQAYYLTSDKVVVGYQLTNSTVPYKVFLPVFSSCRERFLSRIRNEINKFAKFNVAIFRMKLYMKEIDKISRIIFRKSMSSLPEAIVNIIGLYCYDPFLLSG